MKMKKTKRACSLLAVSLLAVGLAACGSTVSTSTFKGESHAVAQRISDYQSDVGAASEKKLCTEDLSSDVRRRLNAAHGGCEEALKRQHTPKIAFVAKPLTCQEHDLGSDHIGSIDDYEATVEQVAVNGATATALVKSTWSGKLRAATVALVKESGSWRIAGVTLK